MDSRTAPCGLWRATDTGTVPWTFRTELLVQRPCRPRPRLGRGRSPVASHGRRVGWTPWETSAGPSYPGPNGYSCLRRQTTGVLCEGRWSDGRAKRVSVREHRVGYARGETDQGTAVPMTENRWRYVGVDWDSGGWIAVGYSGDGSPVADAFETVEDLWTAHGADAERMVVDIPIGLCTSREATAGCEVTDGELSRCCDRLARAVVGRRSPSVFTPPCRAAARAAAEDADYSTVNSLNREQTGKGLMRQAANIADGIVQTEDLLLDRGIADTVVESHPEVCFRAFAAGPLGFNKRTAPGMNERLAALESSTGYERGTWRRLAERLGERGHRAGADDLLDALALALTASAPEGQQQSLPADPPTDQRGLPVQIVYRRSDPFET